MRISSWQMYIDVCGRGWEVVPVVPTPDRKTTGIVLLLLRRRAQSILNRKPIRLISILYCREE
jgi:hypothetical protein